MNRLLIRIWAGVFIALLCSSTLMAVLVSIYFDTFFTDPAWYPIDRTITLVQYIVDQTPVEEFDREKGQLSAILDRRVDVLISLVEYSHVSYIH